MVVRADGSLVIGGQFTYAGAAESTNLAEIDADTVAPAIQVAPHSLTTTAGSEAILSVTAASTGLKYQWAFDGVVIAGATGGTYAIPSVRRFHAGNYTVTVSNTAGRLTSPAVAITVSPASLSSGRLRNVSNRAYCGPGDRVVVMGFVVRPMARRHS